MSAGTHVKFVTLASHACLDRFPENTLSKFSNYFGRALGPTNAQKIYVRLRSIAISPKIPLSVWKEKKSHYARIYLNELEPQHSSVEGFNKCLGIMPFPPGREFYF